MLAIEMVFFWGRGMVSSLFYIACVTVTPLPLSSAGNIHLYVCLCLCVCVCVDKCPMFVDQQTMFVIKCTIVIILEGINNAIANIFLSHEMKSQWCERDVA